LHGVAGDDHHGLVVDGGALLGLENPLDAVGEDDGVDQ